MQQAKRAISIAVLFLIVAAISRSLASAATETVPVWLGSGVTFAALLVSARWWWPGILAGAAVASFIWGLVAHGLGIAGALPFAGIEVVSMAAGAWIATLGRHDAESPAGAVLLIIGALFAATFGGILAMLLWQWQRPSADLMIEARTWIFSTAVGLLLVAPLAVAFRGFRVRRSGGMPMSQFLGGGLAFITFLIAVAVVFVGDTEQHYGHIAATLAYLPMPFLLIAVALWGARGGALAMLAGALLIIARTAQGAGPFAVTDGFAGEAVIEVQGFVAIWAGVMIAVRALSQDRRVALENARTWRLRYERTMQAVGVTSVEYDAVTGRAVWGEGAAQLLGANVTDVTSLDEWIDRIDPAERELVQATWAGVAEGTASFSEQTYGLSLQDGRTLRIRERLAGIRGADGKVEQVVAMLRLDTPETTHG
ncbi:MASE1 domain-containing protein [Chitinimonas naiadis]